MNNKELIEKLEKEEKIRNLELILRDVQVLLWNLASEDYNPILTDIAQALNSNKDA